MTAKTKIVLALAAAAMLLGCARSSRVGDADLSEVDASLSDVLASNDVAPVAPREVAPSPFVQPVLRSRPVDPYTVQYNPTTVITLRGAVLGFRRISLANDQTGLFVRLSGGGDLLWVYLGPEQWLLDHGIEPDMTERLLVTGSMVTTEQERLMVAREITMDGLRVQVRDDWGTPNWLPASDSLVARARREEDLQERRQQYLQEMLVRHERQADEIRQALRDERLLRQ